MMADELSDEFYEGDIEEIVIESDSEDSFELPIAKPMGHYERSPVENENDLDHFYELLQAIIQKTGERPKVFWKPKQTIERAISLCDELVKEEYTLKNDVEQLFQENWKLRKRVEIIEKAKRRNKRKTSSVILRRASEASVASRKKLMDNKRRVSMDDSKVGVALSKTEESFPTKTENTSSTSQKNPKRKSKRHSGMTEEEIEFCTLEEKIEDLLYEVDTLWNEVKDEPDCDEKEDITDIKYDVNSIREEKSDSSTSNFNKLQKSPDANHVSQVNDSKTHKISLKNISKLIDPQFMNQSVEQKDHKVRLRGGKVRPVKPNKTQFLLNTQEIETEQKESARKVIDVSPTNSQEMDTDSKNTAKIARYSPLKQTIETEPKKLFKKAVTIQTKNLLKPIDKETNIEEHDVIIISEGSDSESSGF